MSKLDFLFITSDQVLLLLVLLCLSKHNIGQTNQMFLDKPGTRFFYFSEIITFLVPILYLKRIYLYWAFHTSRIYLNGINPAVCLGNENILNHGAKCQEDVG